MDNKINIYEERRILFHKYSRSIPLQNGKVYINPTSVRIHSSVVWILQKNFDERGSDYFMGKVFFYFIGLGTGSFWHRVKSTCQLGSIHVTWNIETVSCDLISEMEQKFDGVIISETSIYSIGDNLKQIVHTILAPIFSGNRDDSETDVMILQTCLEWWWPQGVLQHHLARVIMWTKE